jgi:hypothetical protein
LDDSVFDDPDRLVDADHRGLLRSAALAGAQVRSTAELAAESGLTDRLDSRPRALVLVGRPGVGAGVCRLLAALLGPQCPVPVVVAESAPAWVGALDVVFAYTDDVGDAELAESASIATQRGATVVLAAPPDGPVAAAAAGRALLLSARIPVPPALSFAHAFTVGVSVLAGLGLLRVDIDLLADELDRESEHAHPSQEPLVNPAKSLALRLADHTALLWGVDSMSTAAAEHGAFALGYHAAMPCAALSFSQAAAEHGLYRSAVALGSADSLFADPEDEPGERLRVFLVSARHDTPAHTRERAAAQALPAADLVTPGESVREDPVVRSALLASRFDLASVYLGLAAGTLNGPGGWQALAVH